MKTAFPHVPRGTNHIHLRASAPPRGNPSFSSFPSVQNADTEIAALRAEIETLETKLALYRRREQLDKEHALLLTADQLRERFAPILQAVCTEFGITLDEFWFGNRAARHSIPRHIARFLAREIFPPTVTLNHLGVAFRRDHWAMISSVRFVRDQCQLDPTFAARVARIRSSLPSLPSV